MLCDWLLKLTGEGLSISLWDSSSLSWLSFLKYFILGLHDVSNIVQPSIEKVIESIAFLLFFPMGYICKQRIFSHAGLIIVFCEDSIGGPFCSLKLYL